MHEAGSLRVRFPNTQGGLEAVIVNTGGGMTGGDDFTIDIDVADGADLVAGTAAAEKIYRSTGPDTAMNVRLAVGAGARLAWLPQETILFDRARLKRRIDVDLAEGATLVMAEAVLFGRAAMGETDGARCPGRHLARAPRRPAGVRRERAARRRHRRQARRGPRRPRAASRWRPC